MKHIEKILKYARRGMFVPFELTNKMMGLVGSTNGSVAVLMSYEMIPVLQQRGIKNITLLVDVVTPRLNSIVKHFGCNITTLETDLKFDVVIGNPPFNVGEEKGKTRGGTSGKNDLFKDFVFISTKLVKDFGHIAMITPKGIVSALQKDETLSSYDVIDFNLMTEKEYWKYDTCYFVLKNTNKRTTDFRPSDKILDKIIDLSQNHWQRINLNKSEKELVKEGIFGEAGLKCIRFLPGHGEHKELDKPVYGFVRNTKYLIPEGPKVVGNHFFSVPSVTATTDPVCAGTVFAFPTKTIEEAESLSLFLKNNKAWLFFRKKGKLKKPLDRFHWFKKFDLSQIKTGYEYPKEWGLTAEEIEYVESNC